MVQLEQKEELNMHKFYSVKQVADILKVNPKYIKTEIAKGRIMALDIGGRTGYRIDEEDLQKYIAHKKKHTFLKARGK